MEAIVAMGGLLSLIIGLIVFLLFLDMTVNIRRIRRAAELMNERDKHRFLDKYEEKARYIDRKKQWYQ